MNGHFGLRAAAVLGAVAFEVTLVPQGLLAQAPWTERGSRPSIALEVQKPSFADGDFSFATGAAFLSARVPAGHIVLIGELPAAFGSISDASSTVIGNPYLGLETGGTEVVGELGMRLPIANVSGDDDFATGVGVFSDFDRLEAFTEDLMSVRAAVRFDRRDAGGFGFGGTMAPALFIPTNDGDAELFVGYAARASYAWAGASVGAEFSGRLLVTEGDLNFGERTVHQVALGAGVDLGPWRPGAYFRLPLDRDLTDTVNHVFGLSLALRF